MRTPWFERDTSLLDRELTAIRNSGFEFALEAAPRAVGFIVLRGKLQVASERFESELLYPASFPFGRPEVRVDLKLPRHSSPYDRVLCLWPGADEDWDWNENEGRQGAYMLERAVGLLSIRSDEEELRHQSERSPDRQGRYLFAPDSGALLIPAALDGDVPTDSWGRAEITMLGAETARIAVLTRLEIFARDGSTLGDRKAEPEIVAALVRPDALKVSARWLKLKRYPPFKSTRDEFESHFPDWLNQQLPAIGKVALSANAQVRMLGAAFPEEWQWSKESDEPEFRDEWVFVLESRQPGGLRRHTYRPFRLGKEHTFARNPSLAALDSKQVTVVGLGALGSPIALGLARAGVGAFVLSDHDIVETGNAQRGAFDVLAAGTLKTVEMRRRILSVNPYAQVSVVNGPWGAIYTAGQQLEDLDEVWSNVSRSDLIVAAVASYETSLDLQMVAIEQQIPFLYTDVVQGAWGGRAFLYRPGLTGCLGCLYTLLAANPEMSPVASPEPEVMPANCIAPTFTGSGFDIESVATIAVRLAVQALVARDDGYPAETANYVVYQAVGTPDAPEIRNWSVVPHPECAVCAAHP